MDLTSRLLLGLARLVTSARGGLVPLEAEPPEALLRAALGELGGEIASAGPAFAEQTAPAERRAALERLAQSLQRTLREQAAQRSAAELVGVIEALLLAGGAVREPSLGAVQLRLDSPAQFHALRLLRLGSPNQAGQALLVGSLARSDAGISVPLRLAQPLEGLALRYEPGQAPPQLQTELWLRVPPDPNKRRLAEWAPTLLAAAMKIELYRQRLPGPDPAAVITHEHLPLPHRLAAGRVSVKLIDPSGGLTVMRTTVWDKFQSPLAIAERIMAQP